LLDLDLDVTSPADISELEGEILSFLNI
jgi:hypothetical protein